MVRLVGGLFGLRVVFERLSSILARVLAGFFGAFFGVRCGLKAFEGIFDFARACLVSGNALGRV